MNDNSEKIIQLSLGSDKFSGVSSKIEGYKIRKGYNLWKGRIYSFSGEQYFIKYIAADYSPEDYSSEENVNIAYQRFEKESRFCVRSPFLVNVYRKESGVVKEITTGKEKKVLCIIEEDVGDVTLKDYYDKKGVYRDKITNKQMFSHMFQLIYGMMSYINLKSPDFLLHRDIKPENIMVCNNKLVKLIDFDWSHIDRRMGTGGTLNPVSGTPLYSHPLQWEENYCLFKGMDIYSLGMVFLYMLLGRDYLEIESLTQNYYKNDFLVYTLRAGYLSDGVLENYRELLPIIAGMIAKKETQYQDITDTLTHLKNYIYSKDKKLYKQIIDEIEENYHVLLSRHKEKEIPLKLSIKKDNVTTIEKFKLKNGEMWSKKFENSEERIIVKVYRAGDSISFLCKFYHSTGTIQIIGPVVLENNMELINNTKYKIKLIKGDKAL